MTDQPWDEAAFWALGICPFCGGAGKIDRSPEELHDLHSVRYICQLCDGVWRNPMALMDFGPCRLCGKDQGPLNPDDPSPDTCPACLRVLQTELMAMGGVSTVVEFERWCLDVTHMRPEWLAAYRRFLLPD
jgi:hypothetical protein